MSRHEIRGREPHIAIVVGWDPPLATYFAQVWDELTDENDEEEPQILWVGCFAREIPTVDELGRHLEPFVTLSPELREQLARDREVADGKPARGAK